MHLLSPFFRRVSFVILFSGAWPLALHAAGDAPEPNVCLRSCWNARSSSLTTDMQVFNRAIIHHTAGTYFVNSISDSQSVMRSIQNLHMDRNGWADVGYHYVVDRLGNLFEGRRDSHNKNTARRGAHDSVNDRSLGISVMGNYETSGSHPGHTFTRPSIEALKDIIAWRMPDGWSPYGSGTYGGISNVGIIDFHRTTTGSLCPGANIIHYVTYNFTGGSFRNAVQIRITGSAGPPVSHTFSPGDWVRTTANPSLNLRAGPGTTYDILRQLPLHTVARVQPHEDNGIRANNNDWWHVTVYPDGASGWLTEFYLEATSEPADNPFPDAIVDNSDPGFSASSNWEVAVWAEDKYGADYHYRETATVSDPARWSAALPGTGTYDVYAWWPAWSNRATAAPYRILHSGGTAVVHVDQTANGGKWNHLGRFEFAHDSADQVELSCWTNTGEVVMADAIRFIPIDVVAPPATLITVVEGGGQVVRSPDRTEYTLGESVQLLAMPDDGFDFIEWSGAVQSSQNPVNIVVTGSLSVTANFARTYAAWVRLYFDEAEQADESISGDDANPAGDGVPNLLKYALGLDPLLAAPMETLPRAAIHPVPAADGETFLTLSFSHPSDTSDVHYRVQLSSDLADWSETAVPVSSEENEGVTTRVYRDPLPHSASAQRFIRLEVQR